jgi:acetolactate synthase I/II/III large subunit
VHLELQGLGGYILNESLTIESHGEAAIAEAQFGHVPPFRPVPAPGGAPGADRDSGRQPPGDRGGRGVRMSGAQQQLAAFSARTGIPVATSLNGKGFIDERSEPAVGVVGASSRPSANQTVERADLMIFIGSRAGSRVTDKWRLPRPGTAVVQIDIDPAQLGRNYPCAVAVHGDAARRWNC